MNDSPRRSGIYPALTYDHAADAIDFLCDAFGFTKRLVVPAPDGGVLHSELSLGEVVVMVSSPKPAQRRVSPRSLPALHQALSVYVPDPDAHHARAVSRGATVVQEPRDEDFGSRGYMVHDLEGHQWYFGTYVPGEHWTGEK